MAAGKGIASVISGPLSEQLLQIGDWRGGGFAYGSQYSAIVLSAGVAAMFGGTACIGRLMKLL